MKINKILAAGVAATLAVTSLSAVASAEVKTREFDMSQSIGAWNSLAVSYKSIYGTKTATDRAYATETNRAVIDFSVAGIATLYKLDGTDEYALQITRNETGSVSGIVTQTIYTEKKGTGTTGTAPNGITKWSKLWSFNLSDAWWSGAEVTVSGYKFDAKGTKVKVTQTAKAENKGDIAPTADCWDGYYGPSRYRLVVLPDDVLTYKEGTAIAPAYFDEIEDVGVTLTLHNSLYAASPDSQYTAEESHFNLATMLLKAIKIPISDAVVNYTTPAGVLDPTADVDATKDGKETYTNSVVNNKALVDGQIAKVVVTYGQTDVEKGITDKIAYMDDNASVARDKTTDPITEGTDVLSTEKYKQVSTMNVMAEAFEAAGAKVAAASAAGFTTAGSGIMCKTADGKFIKLYKVDSPSVDATIADDGTEWAAIQCNEAYDKGDDVYIYHVDTVLPVYTRTENPTTWSGYKQVRAGAVSTTIAAADYILLAGGSYSEPTKDMQTLDAEVAIYDIAGEVKGGNTAAAVIAYCIAHAGYDPAIELKYVEGAKGTLETSNATRYAYLERTTSNSTIGRQKVYPLSITGDWASQNGGDLGRTDSANQSYTTVDNWNKGTKAVQFAGLASQVADFFNKQNNGKITFHFVSPAASGSSWVNGGVPSTEVGLKSALGSTAMAIFFNYSRTTGSLQANGVVDADAATVTFDITDNLNAMGNHTIGTLEDIYYGMNNGLRYSDYAEKDGWDIGYLVDKVTLSFDDAPAAVDANTDDDAADDDAAVVVADDDDDDDVVADDDDDDIAEDDDIIEDDDDDDDDAGEIIEDDDDDDDDVNNDVDYVDADDDANPGTGVGLAVIPAIVAGAALVVSKKRK